MYLLGGAWGWFMPLNKNLWTSSYTLWTAGLCTLTLAACILLVDVLGFRRGTLPGRVFGANAITAYLLAGMLTVVFHSPIWGGVALSGLWMDALTGVGVQPALASAVYAVLYTAVIFLPAYVLYRLRIFIKV
jgi:predicted acyltransferase